MISVQKRRDRKWQQEEINQTVAADFASPHYGIRKRNERRRKRRKRGSLLIRIAGVVLAAVLLAQQIEKSQSSEVGLHTYVRQFESRVWPKQDGQEQDNLLLLVNKTHKVPENYEPELHWLNNGSCAVAEEMYEALSEMLTAGTEEGRQFVVASGYRSRETQQQLLEEDIADDILNLGLSYQEAYEKETRETMPPGYSEHETGLAVDIVALDYQILDEQQELTDENKWLQEHCSEYGFILRYPKGKEDITNIDYESWHFRYVGQTAAKMITEQGITLEEYLENGRAI